METISKRAAALARDDEVRGAVRRILDHRSGPVRRCTQSGKFSVKHSKGVTQRSKETCGVRVTVGGKHAVVKVLGNR